MPHNCDPLIAATPPFLDAAAAWIEGVVRLYGLAKQSSDLALERATECGLSGPQFWILWAVRSGDGIGICQLELAQQTGLSAAHVSAVVEQLRQNGLLEGQRDPADRRRQVWSLAPLGRQRLTAVMTQVQACLDSHGDHDSLSAAVTRVLQAIDAGPVPSSDRAAARREAA